jgi:hypothetical protein
MVEFSEKHSRPALGTLTGFASTFPRTAGLMLPFCISAALLEVS